VLKLTGNKGQRQIRKVKMFAFRVIKEVSALKVGKVFMDVHT